ncbi:SwmB domain-containing protein [Verminephrobacter aporrectodeae]|uniref:SwmB domain-containing protein n=1 Tax=Verminephrobacter aporrectodeae TaxID=1110389 RepID=UPI0022443517|nr:SwmB domain-containing protein [Verminephrobacter aporrectodeae]
MNTDSHTTPSPRSGETTNTAGPTATITLADTALTAGETTTVTFSFSEPVSGFDASDVVLTDANGTLGALTANADGKTWTATFTPTDKVEDSSNTISVNLAGVTNAAGRAGTGSAASTSYSVDTKRPDVVSLTFAKSKLGAGESTTATLIFSEALNRDSFTLAKLNPPPDKGTVSNLHTTDGITWTFTLTAPASGRSGTGILGIQLSNVTDVAGNTGISGYLNQSPYVLDFGPPTATITLADSALTAGKTTTVTFTFSESVNGFDASDIVLTDANGTLGALTLTPDTDNKIWTATFTPTANVNAQANTIRVNLSGVTNNADSAGTSTAASANYTVDTRTDTTPPVIDTATVNGNQLVLTYAEVNTLNAAALTGNAGYAVSSTTDTAITVSSAVVNAAAKTVTLTLSRAVTQTETVKVSYTKPASGAGVQDAAGNDAANFSDRTVTNNTDNTAPQLITTSNVATGNEHQLPTVSGGGSNLVLTFRDTSNLNEDAARKPAAGDFTVSVDGASRTVNSVTVNATGKIILLALATPVAAGQHVTVAYQDSTPDDGKGIQDTANNRLASFPTTEAVNNVLDMDAPQLITTGTTRPTANGNQLVLSFSDVNNLSADPARKPTVGDFTVLVAGAANAVTAVTVNGAAKTITLTLSTAVTPGQTATVAYTDSTPNDTSAIQDDRGNRLTGFAATEVNTPDTTPPVFSSAAVRGNQLVISYAEAGTLDATALPGNAGFTVSTTGTAITVSSAVVNGAAKTVTLTLSRAVTQTETVKVSYTKPESGAVVQDAAGNDAANLSDRAVTNNTPSGTADTTAPELFTTHPRRPELTNSTTLVIRFNDTSNLDENNAPASGDFTVLLDGVSVAVSSVTVDGTGKSIALTLATPVAPRGRSVTVAYQDSTLTNDKGIQDIHSNRLDSFPATAVIDAIPDSEGPELITTGTARPKVNGNQLELSFIDAHPLEAVNKPANGTFTVLVNGVANAVTNVTVDGQAKTVTLTLTTAVTHGQSVTVAYTDPTGRNDTDAIQDTLDQDAGSFAATDVVNNTPAAADTTPPEFSSATVNGNQLVISYTEANTLDPAALARTSFTVSSDLSTDLTVTDAVVNATAKTVTLTLNHDVARVETVRVSYTKPASGAVVQDAAGNDAANFSNKAVTNNTPADTTAPQLITTSNAGPGKEYLAPYVNDKGDELVLTFDDTSRLDAKPDHAPAATDFTVFVAGATRAVSSVTVPENTKVMLLTLATPVTVGQSVTVAYQDSTLNNASAIQDTAGNRLDSFPTTAVINKASDKAAPQLITTGATRPSASGDQLVLRFSDANNLSEDLTRKPATGDFTVLVNGAANAVTAVAVNGADKTITLTLSTAVIAGQTATVAYQDSTTNDTSGIQDTKDNRLASFAATEVTTPPDTTPPAFNSAAVTGNQLVITYTEANTLDPAALPGNAGFTVSNATGTAIPVSSAVVNGAAKTVTLTLNRAVTPAETVKVSYTKPASGAVVQDAAGNDAADFNSQAVANNTPRVPNEGLNATIRITDRALTAGESTTVSFTFTEPVNGFDASDITCTNGTLSTPTANAARTVWTATFTPTANVNAPVNVINVDLAKVSDNAGNPGVGEATSANYAVDTRDTTPPLFHSATVTGDQLVITYTETNTLDAAALAGNAGFTVSSSTGTAITVSSAVVNGVAKTVTLTLSRAVTQAETVKVNYTKPASGAVVQDAAGNDAVDFNNQAVTNNTPAQADTRPPEFIDASVNGNQLELHYADANHLNANHSAPASAFALSSPGAAAISVSDVAITGKTITLTLSRAVANGEKLTLSYTKPATGDNAIQDAAGNTAADLHNQTVYNFTPAPAPAPGPGPTPAPEHDPGTSNADHDGVPDAQENQAIGPKGSAPGDGNNDGIQDSTQAAVASFSAKTSSGSGTSVTLVADSQDGKVPLGSTTRITSLEQKAAPAQTPQALETPIALTSFKATLETAGSSETFSLYVDPKIGANGYWLQDHGGTWVNLASSPYGGKMVDEGGRLRLDFTITDGGAFDADGEANGSITASGTAAQMPLSIVGQAPDVAHGGFWL